MSHTAGMVREPRSGHYLDDSAPPLEQTVAELADSTLKEELRRPSRCRTPSRRISESTDPIPM
jgi:hypothetical protein